MRIERDLNEGWLFSKSCAAAPEFLPEGENWERVDLPHCWNAVDGMIGVPFERGAYWYVRNFTAPEQPLPGGRTYIEVGAAGQTGEIWVNGTRLTRHVGGYSAFRADATEALRPGENTLAILADNRYSDQAYPQRADFTFYGGLYRYVKLVSVAESHITLDDLGGPGVYIDAEPCEGGALVTARLKLDGAQTNQRLSLQIYASGGEPLAEAWEFAAAETAVRAFLPDAKLWDGVKAPNLYTAVLRLVQHNEVLDELSCDFGVRSFALDAEKGFLLNGREYPLRGVCRHQDRLYEGNALDEMEAWEDAAIIAEMGANSVRLAHYQQAQEMYDACDAMGLTVWAEIPYFAQSWDEEAHAAALNEIRELVAQNYNHPSIFCWGLSNEILIGGDDSPKLLPCHRELNEAVKAIDPARPTVIAHEGTTDWEHPIHAIGDAAGWNHYFGWYRGNMEDLANWCDDYHAAHPERLFAITEYGCDSVVTYHSDTPAKMDYTEEYQVLVHENACETWAKRPWIWGTYVWNMFDFGSSFRREGGTMGRNNKGLVSMDRKIKKDSYYVYKAWYSDDPFVHIDGRRWFARPGETTTVRIHSNQPSVELFADGKSLGRQEGAHTFVFENVPISPKGTVLTARAGDCTDSITLRAVSEADTRFTFGGFKQTMDAINWFESVEEAAASLERVPGCFSVHDTLEDLAASPEAKKVILDALTAIAEREFPEGALFGGNLSKSFADASGEGFLSIVLNDGREQALRRIHAALSKVSKS